ncbi:hypothetical protein [Pygmaiobacter massiliensis]|uniref:hypothetical protein n=1 Tax=Pygmaiobacter massiliensis TaxID=1917873 RepID=UPI000C7BF495|nr:hypothetical protein [Pygmaiobacter massiliensis]
MFQNQTPSQNQYPVPGPGPGPLHRKSLFLTFCFACCAGAGQMYLGYTKRGASLMLAFSLIFGIGGFLDLWIFAIFLPVIWFFAFFDAFNLRNASAEYLASHPDAFMIDLPAETSRATVADLAKKYHVFIGIGLIVIGAYAIYGSVLMPLVGSVLDALPYDLYFVWRFMYKLPSLCVAILIILVGIRLVKGGKSSESDDVIEYKGDKTNE